jgi:hypothetical protein
VVELDDDGNPKLSSQSWVIEGIHITYVMFKMLLMLNKHVKEMLVAYLVLAPP